MPRVAFFPTLNRALSATLADARVASAAAVFESHGVAACRAALKSEGFDVDADFVTGLVAYDRRYADVARELFSTAVAEAGAAAHWLCLGHTYLVTERYTDAIAAYRRALTLDSELHDAHWYLWSAIVALGQRDAAIRAFKEALLRVDVRPPAPVRIAIEDTTLCIVDCANHELAARALRESMRGCSFAEARFFTDRRTPLDGVDTVIVPRIESIEAYSRFIMKGLLAHIDTEYVLVIQWDGYVVNPQAWAPYFLMYDYVGAPWYDDKFQTRAHHTVGNGGFALRSRTLMEALQDPRVERTHPEDLMTCRVYRDYLEQRYRIAFASQQVAEEFSFEQTAADHALSRVPFGFHGVVNMARFIDNPAFKTLSFWDNDANF